MPQTIATANRPAYQAYQILYIGFIVAMPLWASTGTKNASYSDVLYIEALTGPETITTVPPTTLDAFRDHGRVRITLGTEEEEVDAVLATAAALGLDVHAITEQLQADAIKAFASSFDQLVATLGEHPRGSDCVMPSVAS